MNHLIWTVSLWLVASLVSTVGLPMSRVLFKTSTDGGYAFSKILSWFAVGYLTFLIGTLGLLPLALPAIGAAIFMWALANAYVYWRMRTLMVPAPAWSHIITAEVLFIVACAGVVYVKGFHPEIYQIERFMDFGFIETLRNSTHLPLTDLWLAGSSVNYYYMGHVIGFILLTLSAIPSVPGFFLLIGFIVGTLAAVIARFAIDVATYVVGHRGALSRAAQSTVASISVFVALFSGSWYMIPWIIHRIQYAFGMGDMPNFFYPEPTRAIAGTITEMPVFSFLVADLHAHVWGMLTALLVLTISFSFWRDREARFTVSRYFWALSFALGMAYMVNSWDAVTLGALAAVILALKYRHDSWVNISAAVVMLAAVAYAVALPWSITNHLPLQGVGLVHGMSNLWQWLTFWGSIITIILVFALRYVWVRKHMHEYREVLLFIGAAMSVSVLFLVLIEVFYMKDILISGEWYRANTVFKVATQVWIWIAVFSGPVFLWFYHTLRHRVTKIVSIFLLITYLAIGAVYPTIAITQAFVGSHTFIGVDHGLDWWKNKYPDDYAGFHYLKGVRDALPLGERLQHIVEAEGDSYTDVSRFSVFLGWPAIVGWPVHEWTWRGSYDAVGKRRDEVREIYTGTDSKRAQEILQKYAVRYIILGAVERNRYGASIQEKKLRALGSVVFQQGSTFIIHVP